MGRSNLWYKKVKKSRINRISFRNNEKIDEVIPTTAGLSSRNVITPPSASRQKIKGELSEESVGEDINSGFRLIDISLLSDAINMFCCCRECGKQELKIVDDNKHSGLVCTFHVVCGYCKMDVTFKSSKKHDNLYEVNTRFVYAMRCIGVGRESGSLFCGIMNMPSPPLKFATLNTAVHNALQETCESSMKNAVTEAVIENDCETNTDLAVSCDGTWMKRGHKSLYGISTVCSVDTGKVLDVQIMSKFCHKCAFRNKDNEDEEDTKWRMNHENECCKNFSGASGAMEAAGMRMIFQRSETNYGVRYIKYLGDGDSSAYKSVCDSNPYGPISIEKMECIGHIQKRMGGRLRRLVADNKGKKLQDGKPLSGKGRLTAKRINDIQCYYGLAIRNNVQDLERMKKAVWAIFFHLLSTDEKPIHNLCLESWCKFKKAIAAGDTYTHKHSLPETVMMAIKPVFKSLADPELLKKCVHGKTQNSNESLNSLIWKRCPKVSFASTVVVRMAAYDACLLFNDGNVARIKVMEKLGFQAGVFMKRTLNGIDERRIKKADAAIENLSDFAKKLRTSKRKEEEDEDEEAYAPGAF